MMVSCGKSEDQFDEDLGRTYIMMAKVMYGNAFVFDEFTNTWQSAIYDKKTPSGKYLW